jgi:hypothetical protein
LWFISNLPWEGWGRTSIVCLRSHDAAGDVGVRCPLAGSEPGIPSCGAWRRPTASCRILAACSDAMVARCRHRISGAAVGKKRRPAEAGLLLDCSEACASPKPADSLGSRSGGRSSSVGSRSSGVGGRSVGSRSSGVGSRSSSVSGRSGSVGGRGGFFSGRSGSVGRSGFFSSRSVGDRGFFSLVAGREGQDASGEEDVKLGVHAFLRRS